MKHRSLPACLTILAVLLATLPHPALAQVHDAHNFWWQALDGSQERAQLFHGHALYCLQDGMLQVRDAGGGSNQNSISDPALDTGLEAIHIDNERLLLSDADGTRAYARFSDELLWSAELPANLGRNHDHLWGLVPRADGQPGMTLLRMFSEDGGLQESYDYDEVAAVVDNRFAGERNMAIATSTALYCFPGPGLPFEIERPHPGWQARLCSSRDGILLAEHDAEQLSLHFYRTGQLESSSSFELDCQGDWQVELSGTVAMLASSSGLVQLDLAGGGQLSLLAGGNDWDNGRILMRRRSNLLVDCGTASRYGLALIGIASGRIEPLPRFMQDRSGSFALGYDSIYWQPSQGYGIIDSRLIDDRHLYGMHFGDNLRVMDAWDPPQQQFAIQLPPYIIDLQKISGGYLSYRPQTEKDWSECLLPDGTRLLAYSSGGLTSERDIYIAVDSDNDGGFEVVLPTPWADVAETYIAPIGGFQYEGRGPLLLEYAEGRLQLSHNSLRDGRTMDHESGEGIDYLTESTSLAELRSDRDGDGLTDITEQRLLTDPDNPDTDGDGTPDRLDCTPNASLDGLGPVERAMLRGISQTTGSSPGDWQPFPSGHPWRAVYIYSSEPGLPFALGNQVYGICVGTEEGRNYMRSAAQGFPDSRSISVRWYGGPYDLMETFEEWNYFSYYRDTHPDASDDDVERYAREEYPELFELFDSGHGPYVMQYDELWSGHETWFIEIDGEYYPVGEFNEYVV
ncbi:MAG: hypothetical protein H7A35_08185 [Planctomycetales bacterium]|nr:hypothetical protein [bacterium]UNM06863.1 MAG: hypothetical protein H7A35_08185 [Planctomycetales bacterium]